MTLSKKNREITPWIAKKKTLGPVVAAVKAFWVLQFCKQCSATPSGLTVTNNGGWNHIQSYVTRCAAYIQIPNVSVKKNKKLKTFFFFLIFPLNTLSALISLNCTSLLGEANATVPHFRIMSPFLLWVSQHSLVQSEFNVKTSRAAAGMNLLIYGPQYSLISCHRMRKASIGDAGWRLCTMRYRGFITGR